MKKFKRLKIVLFLLLFSGIAYGQVFTDYWYGSAADAGMGGSGTAVSADIWSPEVNPEQNYQHMQPGAGCYCYKHRQPHKP